MLHWRSSPPRHLLFILPALFLTLCGRTSFAGNDKNYTYLALGDSVAFGLDIRLLTHGFPPPESFRGYPEYLAGMEHLTQSKKERNSSCPGETSWGFINGRSNTPDYGCYDNGPGGQDPFRSDPNSLHVQYPGTQLQFALSELSSNKHINLVTLNTGANDLLVLQRVCPTLDCAGGLDLNSVLTTYAANLATILGAIRGTQYTGTLILLTYYSPNPLFDGPIQALNDVAKLVASDPAFGVKVADGFKAFQDAAPGKDSCAAGLLVPLTVSPAPLVCDIHPSAAGSQVLAQAIETVLNGIQK